MHIVPCSKVVPKKGGFQHLYKMGRPPITISALVVLPKIVDSLSESTSAKVLYRRVGCRKLGLYGTTFLEVS